MPRAVLSTLGKSIKTWLDEVGDMECAGAQREKFLLELETDLVADGFYSFLLSDLENMTRVQLEGAFGPCWKALVRDPILTSRIISRNFSSTSSSSSPRCSKLGI